jgi:hypothetical protein
VGALPVPVALGPLCDFCRDYRNYFTQGYNFIFYIRIAIYFARSAPHSDCERKPTQCPLGAYWSLHGLQSFRYVIPVLPAAAGKWEGLRLSSIGTLRREM